MCNIYLSLTPSHLNLSLFLLVWCAVFEFRGCLTAAACRRAGYPVLGICQAMRNCSMFKSEAAFKINPSNP